MSCLVTFSGQNFYYAYSSSTKDKFRTDKFKINILMVHNSLIVKRETAIQKERNRSFVCLFVTTSVCRTAQSMIVQNRRLTIVWTILQIMINRRKINFHDVNNRKSTSIYRKTLMNHNFIRKYKWYF